MSRCAYWIPALLWAAFIFYMSSKPAGPEPDWWFNNADKLIHAVLFGMLSACLFLGFRKGQQLSMPKAAILAFAMAVLYGASDEIHQYFTPQRTPDFKDLLANAVGAAVVFLGLLRPRIDTR